MKLKDYIKNLTKGEYKIKIQDGIYIKKMNIEKNGELEQYTLSFSNVEYGVYFPYTFNYHYVKYYDWGYLKKKIIKDYGEMELKQDD